MLLGVRVIHWVITIALIVVVVLQPERNAGFGSIMGGTSESFAGRRRKGLDAFLAKLTVYLAVGFVASSIALTIFRRGAAG